MIKSLENLNNFNIIRPIGFGSFGTVFEGIDMNTNTIVALKFFFLSDNSMTKEIKRELLLLSIIDSKFFPKLHGYMKTEYYLIIVLERCEGITLKEFVDNHYDPDNKTRKSTSLKQYLDEKLIIEILKQILDAVFYLHSSNIIHRDIKLENIIISETNEIKICDFGFAQFFDENVPCELFTGSTQYISPEVFFNYPHDGPLNDIWTIGICLLKLCIGEQEFYKISNGENILSLYSTFEDKISSYRLRVLLKSLLHYDPTRRLSLEGIYRHLKLQVPLKVPFDLVIVDIVTVHLLKELGFSCENLLLESKKANSNDEFKVYKLIFNKVYFPKESDSYALNEEQMAKLYIDSLKTKNSLLCCSQKPYLKFCSNRSCKFEDLASYSNFEYSMEYMAHDRCRVRIHQFLLLIDYCTKKRKIESYEIIFQLVSGSDDDFAFFVQSVLTNFNRSYYS